MYRTDITRKQHRLIAVGGGIKIIIYKLQLREIYSVYTK